MLISVEITMIQLPTQLELKYVLLQTAKVMVYSASSLLDAKRENMQHLNS